MPVPLNLDNNPSLTQRLVEPTVSLQSYTEWRHNPLYEIQVCLPAGVPGRCEAVVLDVELGGVEGTFLVLLIGGGRHGHLIVKTCVMDPVYNTKHNVN